MTFLSEVANEICTTRGFEISLQKIVFASPRNHFSHQRREKQGNGRSCGQLLRPPSSDLYLKVVAWRVAHASG